MAKYSLRLTGEGAFICLYPAQSLRNPPTTVSLGNAKDDPFLGLAMK